MDNDLYLDCIRRFISISESVFECFVLSGATASLLVQKGLITMEELDLAKDAMKNEASMVKVFESIEALRKQLNELLEMKSTDLIFRQKADYFIKEALGTIGEYKEDQPC